MCVGVWVGLVKLHPEALSNDVELKFATWKHLFDKMIQHQRALEEDGPPVELLTGSVKNNGVYMCGWGWHTHEWID